MNNPKKPKRKTFSASEVEDQKKEFLKSDFKISQERVIYNVFKDSKEALTTKDIIRITAFNDQSTRRAVSNLKKSGQISIKQRVDEGTSIGCEAYICTNKDAAFNSGAIKTQSDARSNQQKAMKLYAELILSLYAISGDQPEKLKTCIQAIKAADIRKDKAFLERDFSDFYIFLKDFLRES
jgi:hypothetical protein